MTDSHSNGKPNSITVQTHCFSRDLNTLSAGQWDFLFLIPEEPQKDLLLQTHSKCHLPSSHHVPLTTQWLQYSSFVGKDV